MIRKIKKDPFRSPFLVEWGGGSMAKMAKKMHLKLFMLIPKNIKTTKMEGGSRALQVIHYF